MSAYTSIVLADTPQAYYRLDETSGTNAADSSGNSNAGTYTTSGLTLAQPGCLLSDADTGTLFTSSVGRVQLPSVALGNGWSGFSAECWIKPTTTGPANGSFYNLLWGGNNNVAHTGWIIYFAGTASLPALVFQVGNGTVNSPAQANSITLVSGSNYHVVGVYDGAHNKLYLNGVLIATSSAITGNVSSAGTPSVTTNSSSFFPGTIDEVAIYNTALSATQILNHYAAGRYVLQDQTRDTFSVRKPLADNTRSTFKTRTPLLGKTVGKFNTRSSLGTETVARWMFRGRAFALYLNSVKTFAKLIFSDTSLIQLKFAEAPMVQPNSTVQITVTAKDANNNALPSLATMTCTVTFPDGSASPTYALGSGITNAGSGIYTLAYTTKTGGVNLELWNASDGAGNTVQFLNKTSVSF